MKQVITCHVTIVRLTCYC